MYVTCCVLLSDVSAAGGTAVSATWGQWQPPHEPPQPPPLPPPEPALTSNRHGRGANVPQSGKSNAMVPLLQWTDITGMANLPDILKTWHLMAPAGTIRTTPNISGKWLCFKFCTKGLFCQPNLGQTCDFTHVDLAQPNPWNRSTLSSLIAFMAQPSIPALGITLTQASDQATHWAS